MLGRKQVPAGVASDIPRMPAARFRCVCVTPRTRSSGRCGIREDNCASVSSDRNSTGSALAVASTTPGGRRASQSARQSGASCARTLPVQARTSAAAAPARARRRDDRIGIALDS